MSAADLRSLIEQVSADAEAIFNDLGCLTPFSHCIDGDGVLHLVMPAQSEDKDFAAAVMRVFMEEHKIVRYCFVDEAWTALLLLPTEAEARKVVRVADHPLRKEVVFFSAEDESGMLTAQREILRASGKPSLGPLVINDTTGWSSEGRLVGMLPRRGTVQ
jgi:hypothetical protein